MPEHRHKLFTYSTLKLAELIRSRQITSYELVKLYIDKVKTVNPALNAVVKDRFEEAMAEAKRADALTQTSIPDALPLLHGVPCTIKEAFAVTGMPQTSGLVGRKNIRADKDAIAVRRLRKAGAIVLGVTNISELCMWMESSNRVYGRTNNPYNPKHIVGGSSGGEGAIIGADASPFGLCSDVGGSIRMPGFFNGLFGHKPSSGIVSNEGQYPCTQHKAKNYLTTGILCRHSSDLMPLMKIIATPDKQEWNNANQVDLSKLTVINIPDNGVNTVSWDIRESQIRCAKFFEKQGAKVITRKYPLLKKSLAIWSTYMNLAGETSFSELMGQGKRINVFWQLFLWALRLSPHTLPAIALAGLEMFPFSKKYLKLGEELRKQLEEDMGDQGIILYPSYPKVAPRHYWPILSKFPWVYTAIFNVLEFPVTQVPLGLNKKGLPLGIQIASKWGNDHITMGVARRLEDEFGGWVEPSLISVPNQSHL